LGFGLEADFGLLFLWVKPKLIAAMLAGGETVVNGSAIAFSIREKKVGNIFLKSLKFIFLSEEV